IELAEPLRRDFDTVLSQKIGLGEGDVQAIDSAPHQVVPGGLRNVVGIDLRQQIGIKVGRLLGVEGADGIEKAGIGVPTLDAVVEPGDVEPLLKLTVVRKLPYSLFV